MSQSVEFMNALKKLLKMKGIVYQDVAKALDLSLPSVKRLFSTGDISLSRLDKICEISGIELTDLLKLMEVNKSKFHAELTLEQEEFLFEHPKCIAYLELLFFGWTPQKIEQVYDLNKNQTHKFLSALDKQDLIEWLPGDKVKLKMKEMIKLRPDSKISKILRDKGIKSFINSDFKGELSFQEFMTFKASAESVKKLNSKLVKLFIEYAQEGILEAQAGIEVEAMALHMAVRPWVLAEVLGLK